MTNLLSDISKLSGQKVKIYFNIHKKCWSVVHLGKVVAHLNTVFVQDATFRVQQAGRARVIREQKKNVHAYISGKFIYPIPLTRPADCHLRVWYNPYKHTLFQTEYYISPDAKEPSITTAWGADFVHFDGKEVYRSEIT